jgi:hypothetical protein
MYSDCLRFKNIYLDSATKHSPALFRVTAAIERPSLYREQIMWMQVTPCGPLSLIAPGASRPFDESAPVSIHTLLLDEF